MNRTSLTPPGEILDEKLAEVGMSQAELAGRIGRTKKTVNEIVKGKAPLLPETAIQLEHALGIPARFWTNAEANYRQSLARQEEARRLSQQTGRLKDLPIAQLVKAGWLPKKSKPVSRAREILDFFGVASFDTPLNWVTRNGFNSDNQPRMKSIATRCSRGCALANLQPKRSNAPRTIALAFALRYE